MQSLLIFSIVYLFHGANGHGYLIEPPARNSMWRAGFGINGRNYDDNGLNCGGFYNQYYRNNGKCGVCGDPYQGPLKHQAGYQGGYANGIIARSYREGSTIRVRARLTANHKGYMSFKICPVNDKNKKVTQECLDRYPLKDANGKERFTIREYMGYNRPGEMSVDLQLPPNLRCSQCVLQWKYRAGNNWGGQSVPQETFQNCADVSIQ